LQNIPIGEYAGDPRVPRRCIVEGCINPPAYVDQSFIGQILIGKCEEHKDLMQVWRASEESGVMGEMVWLPPEETLNE